MNNKWHTIWQKKGAPENSSLELDNLLAINGYDTLGSLTPAAWVAYTHKIKEKLRMHPGDSIYEVGCGAGAFLHPFHAEQHPIGGLDYAAKLIDIAQKAMPTGDFMAGGAEAINPAIPYDIVLSQGVFLYFPNYDYATDIVQKMVAKANKSIAILDVPDLSKQEYALALRRGELGEEAYRQRYEGLDHLYYTKKWFADILTPLTSSLLIEDQIIDNYLHSTYRFNIFAQLA